MQRIVVGVDGSIGGQSALEWAIDEARRRNAVVEAVHVWHQPYMTGYPYWSEVDIGRFAADADALLAEAVESVDTTGVTVERKVMTGATAQVLAEEAKGADLLVVGSRGRGGFAGLLLGSVSQQAAHHSPCPIVIVPPPD